MKRFAVVGSVCAAFLLGGVLSAVAQDEHREDERKDARQEERRDQHEDKRVDQREERRRIADEHFKARFGHDHHFAIRRVETVGGRPHFAYGGYNFEIAQPWPAGWSYNDNVYIDNIDGEYYLLNLKHPGVRVAVTVLP